MDMVSRFIARKSAREPPRAQFLRPLECRTVPADLDEASKAPVTMTLFCLAATQTTLRADTCLNCLAASFQKVPAVPPDNIVLEAAIQELQALIQHPLQPPNRASLPPLLKIPPAWRPQPC